MKKKYPIVLTIAGSDSSGGAGIQADLKTFTVLKCYGASVVTALTAQNTKGVQKIFPVDEKFIEAELDSVFSDLKIDAVKIGMLHSAGVIRSVAAKLKKYRAKNIVLDPVMVSTSGDRLLKEEALSALVKDLFPLADIITPNVREASILSGVEIKSERDITDALTSLKKMKLKNILIKSGDLAESDSANDLFYESKSGKTLWLNGKRIDSKNTHGTGCTLSSAIASFLALGYEMERALKLAKDFITRAIYYGRSLSIGSGRGPVNHLFKL